MPNCTRTNQKIARTESILPPMVVARRPIPYITMAPLQHLCSLVATSWKHQCSLINYFQHLHLISPIAAPLEHPCSLLAPSLQQPCNTFRVGLCMNGLTACRQNTLKISLISWSMGYNRHPIAINSQYRRSPIVVQTESKRSPNVVRPESNRSPFGI